MISAASNWKAGPDRPMEAVMTARSGTARQPPTRHPGPRGPDSHPWTTGTLAPMPGRAVAATVAVLVLMAAACSGDATTEAGISEAAAGDIGSATREPATRSSRSPVYVQHGLTGTVETDAGQPVVVVRGVDPIVVYLGTDDAATSTVEDFHAEWEGLSSDENPPQAAFVFGDPTHEPALASLSDPTWNPTTGTATYGIGIPAERDPRLDGIAPTGATLPDEFEMVTMYVAWPGPETVPAPPTTMTTPTTTSTTPAALSTAAAPTQAPVPSPTAPTEAPQPPTTPTSSLPSGPALVTASPGEVRLPSAGGFSTFTLRNTGSGAGSWTVQSIASQGISTSPSSGILLSSGATTVTVTYNGHGPADDFLDQLKIVTSSGSIIVDVVVDG